MAVNIELKRSAVPGKVPSTGSINLGEIAINTYDGKAYFKKNDGTESIVEIASTSGSVASASFATSASYALTASYSDTSTSASYALTSSFTFNAISASYAATASSADNFLVRGTLTAQTIVAQTITSSTDFVTGSTRFGTQLTDTHQFTGSVSITGSLGINGIDYTATSASFDTRITNNSSSIASLSGSYLASSASFDTRITNNSSSISYLSSSYLASSASFDTRITNNSASISYLSSSYLASSASFDTRITNNSASISYLSSSYLVSSASFDTRITNNSASISALSQSFSAFTASYNTGSFIGQFTGSFSGSLSNLQGSPTYIPFFSSSQVLSNSSMYQIGSASIAINQTNITTANPEALYVSQTHPTSINVISGKGNLNNYLQLNIFNTNQGLSASSDIVATANNGDEFSNYIDMGINSENYAQNFIGGPNDAYLYSTGNDLHIGNATPGKPLQLFVGGTDVDAYVKLQLNPNNQHTMSGSLDVSGSIKAFSFTGSLFGTASFANNATSASYALTASFVQNAVSASYVLNAISASFASSGNGTFSGSFSGSFQGDGSGLTNISASSVVGLNLSQISSGSATASISPTAGFVVNTNTTISGSTVISGSLTVTGSTNLFGGTGNIFSANVDTMVFTGSLFQSGSIVVTGSISATNITSSLFGTASFANNATSASYALSASFASTASFVQNAVSASFASTASYVLNAVSSSFAATASSADNFTVRGTLTAQTIVAQTITSSTEFVTGSTKFGTLLSNTHQFTGSVSITGSLGINGVDYAATSASFDTRIINNSASISALSSSFLNASASFDTRILNNSSSIATLSGSFLNASASFDTRITNNSASIASLSSSYLASSASFATNIFNNSSSIAALSSSFLAFSGSYNTGSFTGSFVGNLTGTASWASNALTSSNVQGGLATYVPLWNTNTSLTSSYLNQSGNVLKTTYGVDKGLSLDFNFDSYILGNPGTGNNTYLQVFDGGSVINVYSPNYTYFNDKVGIRIIPTNPGLAVSGALEITGPGPSKFMNTNVQIDGNLFMSGSNRLIYNNDATNNMLFGMFDGSNIYGPYYQLFGNNYSNVTQRGSAEFVYDNRNGGGSGFNIASFNGSTWTRKFRVDDNGVQITGSLEVTNGITGSLFGTSSYALDSDKLDGKDSTIFATTGSNTFIGNQTVTGSLFTTGSNTLIGTTTLTGSLNITGSTTQVGNNTLLGNTTLSGSVTISGSANASANFTLQGHLRLDPSQDPGNANVTASYLFTSASNTATGFDLYYRQNDNLVKFKWIEGMLNTGVLYGGVLSYSGSYFYLTSGSGIIVNHNAVTSSEINPIITYVTWNATTQSIVDTGSQNTYVYIDATGSLQQQTSFFTPEQYHELIPIGRVSHYGANSSIVTGVGNNIVTAYDQSTQLGEFVRAFGPLKVSGLTITPQPGSLRIDIGSGTSYNLGGFYQYSPELPSIYNSPTYLTSSIIRIYRSGSGYNFDNNGGSYYTAVDPTQWDNGSGTLQTVGNSNWSIQRVFVNPVSGRSHIYYGQTIYATYLDAIGAVSTDDFEESDVTKNAYVFAGYLVMEGGAGNTNLAVSGSTNAIIQAGLFRNSVGGSGGASAAAINLDDLADVNITSPSNGQALIYNSGLWINGTPTNATSASFATTASYVLNAVSASFAQTASYVLNAVSSSFATRAITASYADNFTVANTLTAQTIVVQTITSSVDFVTGSTRFGSLLSNTHQFTGSVSITGSLTTNGPATLNNLTGSLFGTASWANNATTASNALTASFVLNAVSSSFATTASFATSAASATSASFASTASFVQNAQSASYVLNAVSASFASTAVSASFATQAANATTASYVLQAVSASFASTAVSASFATQAANATTASYVLQAVSASFASTASFVNTLNQNVLITGSLTVGQTTLGSGENTLVLGLPPNGGVGEGGQLLLQAPGSGFTSASMLDNYQNRFRVLKGSNAGSDAEIASFNMHTGLVQFNRYTGSGAFPGTATANLAVDSSGNVITVAAGGGSLSGGATNYVARWASSTTLTTGSIFDNGTNVGIGTTNPVTTLDVRGIMRNEVTSNPSNAVLFQLTNQTVSSPNGCKIGFDVYNVGSAAIGTPSDSAALAFYTNGLTSERMRITAAGDVGIGTTAPTNFANYTNLAINSSTGGGILDLMFQNARQFSFSAESGINYLGSVTNSSVVFITNSTEKMRIASDGNVGIGTIAPVARLHVSASTGVVFEADGASAATILYVTASGQVGIGTTNPNARLDVSGTGRFVANSTTVELNTSTRAINITGKDNFYGFQLTGGSTTGQSYGLQIQAGTNSTDSALEINNRANTSTLFNVLGNGNVGVGITSPSYKLHISGNLYVDHNDAPIATFVRSGGTNVNTVIAFTNATTSTYIGSNGTLFGLGGSTGAVSNNPFIIEPSATEKIRLTSGGLVGIGTTSPTGRLNVISAGSTGFTPTATGPIGGSQNTRFHFQGAEPGVMLSSDINATTGAQTGAQAYQLGLQIGFYGVNDIRNQIYFGGGPLTFVYSANNGGAVSERMRIDIGGNVGIGTTSPSARLDVSGSATISGSFIVAPSNANELQVTSTGVNIGNVSTDTHTVTGSLNVSGSISTPGTITAQTLVVQTITSSVDFVTGSTRFGTLLSNTHQFTGSVSITGSLAVNGSNVILTNQTSSMSVASASFSTTTVSSSFAATSSFAASGFTIGITQYQTATVASSIAGANNLFTTATGSFTAAKYLYTVSNGANARTGEVLAVWNGGSVQFTDVSTLDIGSTTAVTASVSIVTAQAQLNFQTNTSGWRIKSQAIFI